jgi:hypothetical protein
LFSTLKFVTDASLTGKNCIAAADLQQTYMGCLSEGLTLLLVSITFDKASSDGGKSCSSQPFFWFATLRYFIFLFSIPFVFLITFVSPN